jgi:hypothetical protein
LKTTTGGLVSAAGAPPGVIAAKMANAVKTALLFIVSVLLVVGAATWAVLVVLVHAQLHRRVARVMHPMQPKLTSACIPGEGW